MRETTLAVLLGGTAWLPVVGVYATALAVKGRPDVGIALLYNAPIAFLFLVLLTHLLLQGWRLGVRALLRTQGGTLAVWTVAAALLYLRLGTKSIEVSGHMAWLPLLTAQSWAFGFPLWLTAGGALSTAVALYLKLAVFRGPSGIPGAVAGVLLASVLLLVHWRHTRGAERAGEQPDAADEVRAG